MDLKDRPLLLCSFYKRGNRTSEEEPWYEPGSQQPGSLVSFSNSNGVLKKSTYSLVHRMSLSLEHRVCSTLCAYQQER